MAHVLHKAVHPDHLARKAKEALLLMSDELSLRWQDRAGDEIEQTGSYSSQEYDLARASALEHGGLEAYSD